MSFSREMEMLMPTHEMGGIWQCNQQTRSIEANINRSQNNYEWEKKMRKDTDSNSTYIKLKKTHSIGLCKININSDIQN